MSFQLAWIGAAASSFSLEEKSGDASVSITSDVVAIILRKADLTILVAGSASATGVHDGTVAVVVVSGTDIDVVASGTGVSGYPNTLYIMFMNWEIGAQDSQYPPQLYYAGI